MEIIFSNATSIGNFSMELFLEQIVWFVITVNLKRSEAAKSTRTGRGAVLADLLIL